MIEEFEEEELEERIVSCNVFVAGNRAFKRCAKILYWYHPMEGTIPVRVEESERTTIKFDNLRNLVEKLRESKIPHTVDTELGRIYVDEDFVGAIAKDVSGCTVLLKEVGVEGEIRDVQLRDGVTICASKKDIEKFKERLMKSEGYNKISRVKDHPMLKLTLAKNYKYVNLLDVEELADRYGSFKGIFLDDEIRLGYNPVWLVSRIAYAKMKGTNEKEVAEELLHTVIHEETHYNQFINREEFKGGWDAGIGAIFGIPSPWGVEERAETVASEAVRAIKEATPDVVEEVKKFLKYKSEVVDLKEAEKVGKAMEKYKDVIFFGSSTEVDAVDEEFVASVHVDDDYLKKKGFKEIEGEDVKRYYERRTEFEYKVLKELLGKEGVRVELYDFASGFFSDRYPAVKVKIPGLIWQFEENQIPEE